MSDWELYRRAIYLYDLNRYDDALEIFQGLYQNFQGSTDFNIILVSTCLKTGNLDLALSYSAQHLQNQLPQKLLSEFCAKITIDKNITILDDLLQTVVINPEQQLQCAQIFCELENFPFATKIYEKNLKKSFSKDIFNKCINAFYIKRNFYDIKIFYEKYIDSSEYDLKDYLNYSVALLELGDLVGSLNCITIAINRYPSVALLYSSRAIVYRELKEYQSAIDDYRKALQIDPGDKSVLVNKALIHLLLGDFETGWALYENRLLLPSAQKITSNLVRKRLPDINSVKGKKLLVLGEQGFGDCIQFSTLLSWLLQDVEELILLVQEPLYELFKGMHPKIKVLKALSNDSTSYDYYCSIMSLPYLVNPNLVGLPLKNNLIATKYNSFVHASSSNSNRAKIGIAWSGNVSNPNDHRRSIDLNTFKRFFTLDADFYILQNQLSEGDAKLLENYNNVTDLSCKILNFHDLAMFTCQMNYVITVDSAVAHLSGVLGIKTHILLPFAPDFRWGVNSTQSLWYPTANLHRQQLPNDWGTVVDNLLQQMKEQII